MSEVDQYLREVVQLGDEGSDLLAKKCVPTLKNCEYVDVVREGMNGLAVLRIPGEYELAVHSTSGDPKILDPAEHAASLVDRLYEQANRIEATPLGFANVIDASTGTKDVVEKIADALVTNADKYGVAILNGELAILGNRVNCDANISGTMVSLLPKTRELGGKYSFIIGYNETADVFDPRGMAVYINSDGVGTKTEFYERSGNYTPALKDSLEMKLADKEKIGAKHVIVHDSVEYNDAIVNIGSKIFVDSLLDEAWRLSDHNEAFVYRLHPQSVGSRLRGWTDRSPAFNVSGSAVSVINEKRLKRPLVSKPGEYIIAIRGEPNPRSNGITDKRRIMVEILGNKWHTKEKGDKFMKFLATPSTMLFPVFSSLIENGNATSVYHMSGGAYNGKLARPLAKQGLYARLDDIFLPDPIETTLAEYASMTPEVAYAKWPMGNDGFVTTKHPEAAIENINNYGLDARVVGVIAKPVDDRTGVELVGIKGSDGKNVYFSGK